MLLVKVSLVMTSALLKSLMVVFRRSQLRSGKFHDLVSYRKSSQWLQTHFFLLHHWKCFYCLIHTMLWSPSSAELRKKTLNPANTVDPVTSKSPKVCVAITVWKMTTCLHDSGVFTLPPSVDARDSFASMMFKTSCLNQHITFSSLTWQETELPVELRPPFVHANL